MSELLTGPVHVIGAGLLGTSVGLALRRAGVPVWLSDRNAANVRTAAGLGAGERRPRTGVPQLVVVAVPPEHIAEVVESALRQAQGPPGSAEGRSRPAQGPSGQGHEPVVTDVGSVKSAPLSALRERVAPELLRHYVGSHPMAGSERSGPLAASQALFDGRPWAVTPGPEADPRAVALVEELARLTGATVVRSDPDAHDRAVARVSHLPHLMAVLVAGQLADADPAQLALSGQGVRDVTRIASGDPALWRQIIGGNAPAVREVLTAVQHDLAELLARLEDPQALTGLLARGNRGTAAIPGKHGGPSLPTEPVYVAVPDHPGGLARIFADIERIGTNVEDVRIDHDPGRPVGLLEVTVAAESADGLRDALEAEGWAVHR